jgi:cytochrome c
LKTRIAIVLLALFSISLWGAEKSKKASRTTHNSPAEGEKVFNANCAMCHFADKTDNKMGPGLKGLFKNKLLPSSHTPATEENVREQILKGNPHGKPVPMPGFAEKLKPEQVDSLIEYLKTL